MNERSVMAEVFSNMTDFVFMWFGWDLLAPRCPTDNFNASWTGNGYLYAQIAPLFVMSELKGWT
jgi:hypothetical protein